jgi:hypothetical protein
VATPGFCGYIPASAFVSDPGLTECPVHHNSKPDTNLIMLDSVPIATIVELAFLKKGTKTDDPTFDMCEITIFEVIIQCLSIVTACWGQLSPFLSWMRSNGLRLDGVEHPTSSSYKMHSQSQGRSRSRDTKSRFENHETFPLPMRRDQILVTQDWEVNSQSSQADMIVESETHIHH